MAENRTKIWFGVGAYLVLNANGLPVVAAVDSPPAAVGGVHPGHEGGEGGEGGEG